MILLLLQQKDHERVFSISIMEESNAFQNLKIKFPHDKIFNHEV